LDLAGHGVTPQEFTSAEGKAGEEQLAACLIELDAVLGKVEAADWVDS
jgi:hypothetical protein